MFDPKEGILPDVCVFQNKVWWTCGFCNELLCEKEAPFDDVIFCVDECPNCGVKVNKRKVEDVEEH